jgi:hypothetical protein
MLGGTASEKGDAAIAISAPVSDFQVIVKKHPRGEIS